MLKNQRGSVTSIDLLVMLVLLSFICSIGLDCWMAQVYIQRAEHIKNYYLDRIRLEGCLTKQDLAMLNGDINNAGLKITNLSAPLEEASVKEINYDGSCIGRILRGDIEQEVWLNINIEIKAKPMVTTKDKFKINVSGKALSERVEP